MTDGFGQSIKIDDRVVITKITFLLVAEQQEPRVDLPLHAMREVEALRFVQRHGDSAAHQAAEKCRDPFRTVFSPEQDAVACAYAARFKLTGELTGRLRESLVRPASDSQSALMRNRNLTSPEPTSFQ